MIIKRAITHKIQMPGTSEYRQEGVTVTAEVTVDTEVARKTGVELSLEQQFDAVDELLNLAIENDLKEAVRLSDPESYVREWNNG